MAYTTQGIRNVGLVGQAGGGKTCLLESLLVQAGAPRKERKPPQHTLETAICGFDHDKTHVNLIDTPGYPDFLGRTLSVLEAVETAAVVVSAKGARKTSLPHMSVGSSSTKRHAKPIFSSCSTVLPSTERPAANTFNRANGDR